MLCLSLYQFPPGCVLLFCLPLHQRNHIKTHPLFIIVDLVYAVGHHWPSHRINVFILFLLILFLPLPRPPLLLSYMALLILFLLFFLLLLLLLIWQSFSPSALVVESM